MLSWCRKDSELVEQIEAALAEADPKSGRQPDGARLGGLLKTLGTSCKDCHAKYRDQ